MDLVELTARDAAQLIRDGEISSVELTRACLERIAARNDTVHAFVHCDPEFSLEQARLADSTPVRSPLHGIPFAVKDVIDTGDFPTEYGTPIHRGRRPGSDARCVGLMREAGAVLLGKAVTTEYAMFTPNATRHPLNPAHTPGGSSSGTAAAVADRMVPIAFGNQTAGSLIRPAAFCGVYGLKPTHGTTDGSGILPLQPYFDTLGYMARGIGDLQDFYSIVRGESESKSWTAARRPRIGICRTHQWEFAAPETRALLARAATQLSDLGFAVETLELPPHYAELVSLHRRILYRGIADSLNDDFARASAQMSAGLRDVIEEGRACTDQHYADDRARADQYRATVNDCFGEFDALLCPSAPGEAPAGTATGDPVFQVSWTLLGVPCLNLPMGNGPQELPLGLQLIGRRHADADLMTVGEEIMREFQPVHISD
ncbi:MAG: amidase [Gammaproteobacteria bacterium]|jgi:Asp-tRNA(Asn)/Glu-tRNA(Gln) amidotransferase A subunit family amidase